MVDLKSEAPVEIRGEFQPIATSVPGIEICEHLPKLAQRMDKLAIIRSLVGSEGRHASFQCLTGWPVNRQPAAVSQHIKGLLATLPKIVLTILSEYSAAYSSRTGSFPLKSQSRSKVEFSRRSEVQATKTHYALRSITI